MSVFAVLRIHKNADTRRKDKSSKIKDKKKCSRLIKSNTALLKVKWNKDVIGHFFCNFGGSYRSRWACDTAQQITS